MFTTSINGGYGFDVQEVKSYASLNCCRCKEAFLQTKILRGNNFKQ